MKRPQPKKDSSAIPTINRAPQEPTNITRAEEIVTNNPASHAKLALIQEKQKEVEETNKVKELSAQMVANFREISEGIKDLTESAQGVGNTLENWDMVFSTMSEMNKGEDKTSEVWVQFKMANQQLKDAK